MKLRNLMYATMIACAFASCSKDEDGITPDGGNDEANATLEVKAFAKTKALPDGSTQEEAVNSLQLLVFNGTGDAAVLEAIGTEPGEAGAGESVKTKIKPGNKTVVVLANVDVAKTTPAITAGTTTFGTLKTTKLTFVNGENNAAFTMNSKAYQVTLEASAINYMGYGSGTNSDTKYYIPNATETIKLYRNVAKISLTGVTLQANASQYPGAALILKQVFILHGHNVTNVVGAEAAEWGAINNAGDYLNGATNEMYKDTWVKYMLTPVDGKTLTPVYPFITYTTSAPYALETSYSQALTGGSLTAEQARNLKPFFTYENTEAIDNYRTLLVVKADFSFNDVDGNTKTYSDRYYPLAVGYNAAGVGNTTDFSGVSFASFRQGALAGVLRNLHYGVNLKITGPGYETPFGPKPDGGDGGNGDTYLDGQVEVVDFGAVLQEGEIE